MTSKLKQERINKGLCPICGEQAAPYYLCDKCRGKAILRRFLNRAVEAGAFRMKKVGRENTYAIGDENADFSYRFPEKFDKRHEPRFRNIPVDVEKELLNIFLTNSKDGFLTEEEIYAAWGKLRLRKGRTSAAQDMATILKAKEKRERRKRKWAQLAS